MASKYFYVGVLFFGLLAFVDAIAGYPPNQGFFVAVNSPVLGRAEDAVTLYAIHTNNHDADNTVQFKKEGGLVAHTVQDGQISKGGVIFGCFLRVGLPNKYRGTRYGTYDATFTPVAGSTVERYGFVRSRSDILDTRGVYTHTVWPASSGAKTPIDNFQDNNIGVRWSPGCRSIQWCKGKKRNVNTGPRLQLTSTDDAGVYTIRRGKRGARGWFVQIKVIAATCQKSQHVLSDGECRTRSFPVCENGGVLKDADDTCTCPPFFFGQICAAAVDEPAERDFVLAYNRGSGETIRCGDLDGGNPKCRGHLFCLGDLYGCTCASGWWGSNCDRPCAKGKWGVGCSQNCGQDSPYCDRFFGP
ncbi:uncharacterized protein [Apostichopus japonicus]|uniref:uncharacterized protein n=1 Tax=Stichopus japonicus TaxID=307972 RepID=UPI003AB37220